MRKIATGVALGAGLLGGVVGATAFAPAVATAVTTGSTEPVTERIEEIKDALAGLVDDGSITQDQADEVAETLGNSDLDFGRHHGPRPGHVDPETLADILGITVEELMAAAENDQTLAEVAEAEGLSKDELIDKLVAAVEAELDEEVAEGDLTKEEADSLSAELTDRVTEMVEEPLGFRGHGPGRGHGHGFGRDGDDSGVEDNGGAADDSMTSTPGTAS